MSEEGGQSQERRPQSAFNICCPGLDYRPTDVLSFGTFERENSVHEESPCYLLSRHTSIDLNRGPHSVGGHHPNGRLRVPCAIAQPWEHDWERYFGYEADFGYGIRRPAIDGYTSSTMYWGGPGWCGNCGYGPIEIRFSKPVKNIHFTLYNWYNYYNGPIRWDGREFFSGPPTFGMNITPYMTSQESRVITVPAVHVRYLDIDTNNGVGLDDFSFEVEDDTQNTTTYRVDLGLSTDPGLPSVVAQTITPGTDVSAQLALGTIFSVGVSKRQPDPFGGPATITSIASTYTKSADKIVPALETNVNLFPDSPVVQLAPDPTTAVALANANES